VTGSEHTQTFGAARGSSDRARAAGNAFDLDAVYRLHASDVSRWLRQLARTNDVSDLLHEVFVVAQRKGADFRGDASVRTWLYAIAVRIVSAWRRKQRLRRLFFLAPRHDDEPSDPIDPKTPFALLAEKHATQAVNRVLERLSERDRVLIVSFELEGLDASEVQAIVGLTPNGVWVALHRARKRFRKIFVDLYGSKE
jgi:RNA polymerase sigma-70 factor (ECF subfamily)